MVRIIVTDEELEAMSIEERNIVLDAIEIEDYFNAKDTEGRGFTW